MKHNSNTKLHFHEYDWTYYERLLCKTAEVNEGIANNLITNPKTIGRRDQKKFMDVLSYVYEQLSIN